MSVVMTTSRSQESNGQGLGVDGQAGKKVPGWHGMKKKIMKLVDALLQHATDGDGFAEWERPRQAIGLPRAGDTVSGADQDEAGRGQRPDVPQRCQQERLCQDRLVVMVRDPYWLHAYWELSRKSVERAKVALGSTGMAPGRCCGCTRFFATARPLPAGSRSETLKSTVG